MNKKIYGAALISAFCIALAGCGTDNKNDGADSTTEAVTEAPVTEQGSLATDNDGSGEADIDVQAAADDILASCSFKDTLAAVDKSMAITRLYNLDETKIEEAAFYTNSNATAEEIAVIKTTSEDYTADVKEAYLARISSQEEACRDYLPDEMTKLESAVVYTNGNYAVLCISNDNSAAETFIEDLFK